MSNRATREELQNLHTLLTRVLIAWIEGHRDNLLELKPAHMALIAKFLKDNGVTKDLPKGLDHKATLEELADMAIPFLPHFSQVRDSES